MSKIKKNYFQFFCGKNRTVSKSNAKLIFILHDYVVSQYVIRLIYFCFHEISVSALFFPYLI